MRNLFTVLTSPGATFERLRGNGGWVISLIVLCVLSAAALWLQWPMIEQQMTEVIESSGQPIPAEDMDVVRAIGQFFVPVVAAVFPVFGMFFLGLLLFLLNMIVRGEGSYMQLAKVALYSLVPGALGGLLTAALAAGLNAGSLQEVALNGGAFFAEKSGFAFTLASSVLDPFALWSLVILVAGSAVMMKKSAMTVGIWIVGAWLLLQLGSAATGLAAV